MECSADITKVDGEAYELHTFYGNEKNIDEELLTVKLYISDEEIVELDLYFDLALRKYITKVNEVELTTANTRVPNINKNTITRKIIESQICFNSRDLKDNQK